ncbi:repressor [Helicobacter winghamensis]|uniref:S24 family peptidase n=1 Tax=Helicobacter winghamensis TaxID=157268 RepID=UPI0001A2837B|nr:S24 family peptidase [Helicobacter winghamensis]EEO26015.1 peptidase S24-like protein [Helicobacter winghamensis ATCC BAA-430]PKT78774.1 repressor [Helicobacter winghamensis]PKT78808.1 repressor [Helicobacter winghamensis]
MDMEEIIEKLKDILASEGQKSVKTIDVAKALNIHPDTFNSMKFRNSIPYKQILNFLEKRNISINYFFFGSSPKESLQSEDKYRILKLYKTNASLGGGGINEFVECQEIIIDNALLHFFQSQNCELITSFGESMEPIIKDGSICVLDKIKPFKDKGIYGVNTREGLFVKQVFKQENGVILHSLNPIYQDLFFENGEYLIIGRVIAEIRKI